MCIADPAGDVYPHSYYSNSYNSFSMYQPNPHLQLTFNHTIPKYSNSPCINKNANNTDTYGEHFTDLEDFQEYVSQTLVQPNGIYSFFNGLAPDNLFFHGVACQCVKLQLAKLGLDSEFVSEYSSIKLVF